MDPDELAQISDSLRQAMAGAGDVDALRRAIAEFGWQDLLAYEPEVAVPVLFALQGELLTPASFLDTILVDAAGLDLSSNTRVVLPRAEELEPTSVLDGDRVAVDGIVQRGGDQLLVPCRQEGEKLALVTCAAPAGSAEDERTLDARCGWTAVQVALTPDRIIMDGEAAMLAWARMGAAGRRAISHELVVVGGEMLRLAVDHVTTREQFGRTLASFQAVKHKLADVRLWQEAAVLSAEAAWEDGGPESAALAKAAACRFSASARQHCQQVLGGMGFTWEHAFHTYLRRALVLEPLLGGADLQHRVLGEALRAGTVAWELGGL